MRPPGKTTDAHERFRRIAGTIVELPTLPALLDRLNRVVQDPATSAQDVASLIAADPVLTAKVLKAVNSPFYGAPKRISSVHHAIVTLGFAAVRSIVLGSSIGELIPGGGRGGLDSRALWTHSLAVGAAARAIGRRLHLPQTDELFVAGLLHDVGKVVADVHLRESFARAVQLVRDEDILLLDAERRTLSITHAEIGAMVLEQWNLAPGVVDAVRCHHNPVLAEQQHQQAAAAVHLADLIARALGVGSGGDRRIPRISDHAWQVLGFRPDDLDGLLAEAATEISRAAESHGLGA